ncbi:MAG: alpha/beta hydrolase [Tepidisphaeraceae bacterium]|jgi:acetyl esterase/lipase
MTESRAKFIVIVASLGIAAWAAMAGAATAGPATRPVNILARQWIPKGFHAIRDVAYVPHGLRSQMLDLYVPDVATSPRPLMVWIHGGGWYGGDKSAPPGLGLLLRGYVVASIDYRLSGEAVFPAQIFDCKAAIRFLRVHSREYGIDPMRIGVWGDSAGGQLAALLGTTNGRKEYEGTEGVLGASSSVQAVCDWYGPSDFLQTTDWNGAGASAARLLFGGVVSAHAQAAALASPAEQVGRAPLAPFLIMHGDQDPLVSLHQSQVLFQKLQKAGGAARLVILHGGHGNGWFKNRDDLTMVYDFFDRCFGKSPVRALSPATRPST